MVKSVLWGLVAFIAIQRAWEVWLAERNRGRAYAMGGRERGARHYPLIVFLHTAWFFGWIVESLERGPHFDPLAPAWGLLFVLGEVLRYWCMISLGPQWNTRIIVVPGSPRVRKGPYRFLHHPNYLGVAIFLLAVPLIFGAWITASVATIANGLLLLFVRIPEENRALEQLRD